MTMAGSMLLANSSNDDIVPMRGCFFRYCVVESDIFELFYSYTDSVDSDFTPSDREFIHTMIKATMAEQIYESWARYYLYCQEYDYTLQQALKVANDPNTDGTILSCEDK
jgi:hypothetical protein